MNHTMNYFFENNYSDFLKNFEKVVNLESPTQRKDLNDKLADFLEHMFSDIALVKRIKQDNVGDNLLIEFTNSTLKDTVQDQVLILCHMDTVWDEGTISKFPFKIIDDKITGPGTYDMKFGIIQAYYTMKFLKENKLDLNYNLLLYINSDEETGSFHSEKHIQEIAKKCKCVLVLEPSETTGFAKTQRKGMLTYEINVLGKASHAGAYHQDGISAIKEISNLILKIEALTNYKEGITANVGIVKGGNRINVIPEKATAELEFRFVSEKQSFEIEKFMETLEPLNKNSIVQFTKTSSKMPIEKNDGNCRLYSFIEKSAKQLSLPMGEIFAGGLSDGNITSAMKVPTIDGLGAIGSGSHSLDEYVDLPSIKDRLNLLQTILINLKNF